MARLASVLPVLLVTHDVDEALLVADRAVVLVDGRNGRDVPVDLDRPAGVETAASSR